MHPFSTLVFSTCLLGLSLHCYAELSSRNVFLLREAPKPEQLAAMMYPQRQSEPMDKFKLRGIRFADPAANNSSKKPAEQQGMAVGMNIRFALNDDTPAPDSLPYLDAVGEMLTLTNTRDARLLIAGHADASGDSSYNQTLSTARAQAVADYLTEKYRIDPARLDVAGFGESSPLPQVDPYDGLNRRVEFVPR